MHQTLPFYQEIEYFPAPQYAQGINEVELTVVTNPNEVFDDCEGDGGDEYLPHVDGEQPLTPRLRPGP